MVHARPSPGLHILDSGTDTGNEALPPCTDAAPPTRRRPCVGRRVSGRPPHQVGCTRGLQPGAAQAVPWPQSPTPRRGDACTHTLRESARPGQPQAPQKGIPPTGRRTSEGPRGSGVGGQAQRQLCRVPGTGTCLQPSELWTPPTHRSVSTAQGHLARLRHPDCLKCDLARTGQAARGHCWGLLLGTAMPAAMTPGALLSGLPQASVSPSNSPA